MQAATATKACPVVLRRGRDGGLEILAFVHPLAGCQLVKGGIEAGEAAAVAALRELSEESGIADAHVLNDMGVWASQHGDVPGGALWSFHLCDVPRVLPERWSWRTADDGGQTFEFFWQALDAPVDAQWHPLFQRALAYVRHWLRSHEDVLHA
ncbi:MAG: NUDIX domain-containing protein [Moraxellaceae bacterium]|nr:NUDIX domain-containing protein [Moraxellaceae bacterium]